MITTGIAFDRRGQATKKTKGTVEIRVTVNRRNQYISSGVRIYKNEWKDGMIINRPDSVELMERVYALKRQIEKEVTRCIDAGIEINLQTIRDGMTQQKTITDMWEWLLSAIATLNVSQGTRAHYSNMMVKFMAWGRVRRWTDCTVEMVREWDGYLHTLHKPLTKSQEKMIADGGKVEREPLSDAGIYNYHKCLKALLHIAFDEGKIVQNPYDRMKGKLKRGDKENVEYLVEDEIRRIRDLDGLSRIYDEARDLFVFQMFTGLPYADLMAFRFDDYREVDGKWVIRTERIKTGVPYVNVLLTPALNVLQKYGGCLPYINNAEYNERLKVIGRMADVKVKMHTHLARHTFATMMLSKGVKIEIVSKMLGHTNITQTQRYAKVLAKDVREEFDRINAEL